MIAIQGDELVYAIVAGVSLGIILAIFDAWFQDRVRRGKRNNQPK